MQQSKAVRITGTAMLALTVLFCVLPFLSMLSAAAARFHARRYPVHCPPALGELHRRLEHGKHHPAAAQQLHSGDRGRALRGDLLLARRLCLRSAQGAVQGPDLRCCSSSV